MGQKLLWLVIAGATGTLARYFWGGFVQRIANSGFPWGTLAVNGLGCFLFGLIWSLAEERSLIGSDARFILLVGFLGSFTTFSSYAFETSQFIRDTQWTYVLMNIAAQNIAGLILVFLGFALGRAI